MSSHANKYAQPHVANIRLYPSDNALSALYASNTTPMINGKITPPSEPAKPPIPTTEETACLGNISDTVVNMFADHAWCADAAILIKNTACQISVAQRAPIMGTAQSAKKNIEYLRALYTGQPFFINQPEI